MKYRDAVDTTNAILKDPCASDWIKDALRTTHSRDIVDATNDAELLAQILRARCDWCIRSKA